MWPLPIRWALPYGSYCQPRGSGPSWLMLVDTPLIPFRFLSKSACRACFLVPMDLTTNWMNAISYWWKCWTLMLKANSAVRVCKSSEECSNGFKAWMEIFLKLFGLFKYLKRDWRKGNGIKLQTLFYQLFQLIVSLSAQETEIGFHWVKAQLSFLLPRITPFLSHVVSHHFTGPQMYR